jgi:hypothetical protein
MNTTNFADKNTSEWLRVLYCLALAFSFAFAGCANKILNDFSRLETEALKYGTVSVGAVRVTDYNNPHLWESREKLQKALNKFREELGHDLKLYAAAGGSKNSNPENKSPGAAKVQTPGPSEIELVGLRMAALKFVESELRDIKLDCISPIECGFRRVVVSLDCSAWVRGEAGAALVYIDLYPYKVDCWCHEAGGIMSDRWDELKGNKKNKKPKGRKYYECRWNEIIKKNLKNAFKSLDQSKMQMPPDSEIKEEGPCDWVGFCHSWLKRKSLFPHIVHVERMGKTEYLILAEEDYSSSKFGISGGYPGLPTPELGLEARKEERLRTSAIRPLSLAFIAGDRRAGWLFMPGKTTEGRMPPTERRLRIVVDIPDNMSRLSIHVHKVFLDSDLRILPDASLAKQMKNLELTREALTKGDDLYKEYKEQPKHYRLIKTRMRNLLYQGWAEEIPVDIPEKSRKGQYLLRLRALYNCLSAVFGCNGHCR